MLLFVVAVDDGKATLELKMMNFLPLKSAFDWLRRNNKTGAHKIRMLSLEFLSKYDAAKQEVWRQIQLRLPTALFV